MTPSAFNPGSSPIPTPKDIENRMKSMEREDKSSKRSFSRHEAARSGERLYQKQLVKEQHISRLKIQREAEISAQMRDKPAICRKSIKLWKLKGAQNQQSNQSMLRQCPSHAVLRKNSAAGQAGGNSSSFRTFDLRPSGSQRTLP